MCAVIVLNPSGIGLAINLPLLGQPPSPRPKNPVKVVPKNRKAGLLNPAFPTHSTLRTKSLDAATHRQHAITLPKPLSPSSHQYWGQTGKLQNSEQTPIPAVRFLIRSAGSVRSVR